ncbi:ABC-type Fe3+ transport system substrate-binding protein [Azospirillum brasilense]|nr:ABC transporter substrate-binding protein [Azospirillum baldaniorum]TWA77914.1 ABC-type Fe3+ transport system substrate-binding protein [Azospirillum brasilense]
MDGLALDGLALEGLFGRCPEADWAAAIDAIEEVLPGDAPSPRGLDFLGGVPVPLRHRVRDGLADVLIRHRRETGRILAGCFPMGQGGRTPFDRLRRIRRLEDFPAMLVSADHGNTFNRRFHREHVAGGAFRIEQPGPVAAPFADCGLPDPEGRIAVFAVAPFVILADRRRLRGRPVPRRWSDLLGLAYRGQLAFGGWRRPGGSFGAHVNHFFLLAMHRMFGDAGLRCIAANTATLTHSAEMPRVAGTVASPAGVYVLPWSLAGICPHRAETELVWPEDGALAYPLWMTVKAADRERLDPLVRHMQGPDLGRLLADNRYPPLCPEVPSGLPPGARLWWPGWEVVRARSTADTLRAATRTFFDAWSPPCA